MMQFILVAVFFNAIILMENFHQYLQFLVHMKKPL